MTRRERELRSKANRAHARGDHARGERRWAEANDVAYAAFNHPSGRV